MFVRSVLAGCISVALLSNLALGDDIGDIVKAIQAGYKIEKDKKAKGEIDKVRRDAHPKQHGCMKADITVPKLEGDFAKGVFSKPGQFTAWIRFSNGAAMDDWNFDGRGMAIKLVGVTKEFGKRLATTEEKETQDFLMINHPQFFVRNVKDYVEFNNDKKKFFATHEYERGIIAKIGGQLVTSPLELTYFSMVPVNLGDKPIKYRAIPCDPLKKTFVFGTELDIRPLAKAWNDYRSPEKLAEHKDELKKYENFMGTAVAHQLRSEEGCFKLQVQFQGNPENEPVDDPTIEWKGDFHTVADIKIRKWDVPKPDTERWKKWDEFCENLAFTPWHGVEDLRPIGGIQEARLPVYATSAPIRTDANGKKLVEPTGKEVF